MCCSRVVGLGARGVWAGLDDCMRVVGGSTQSTCTAKSMQSCRLSLVALLSPALQPEDEEEEEAAAYQRASEHPSGRRRALPRGGSQGRGGRGQLALAAVEQEEEEEEDAEEGQQWEEEYEEAAVEEGEEEEEDVPVLPTEEQLPTGRRGGRPPRQRRLQPMFGVEEDEEGQDGEEVRLRDWAGSGGASGDGLLCGSAMPLLPRLWAAQAVTLALPTLRAPTCPVPCLLHHTNHV